MRAIVQDRYGPTEVLELRDIARSAPCDDEVLIGVHAAGVDRGVWHLMTGRPYLVRPAFGFRGPRTPVPGMALAGVVEAVGARVTRFAAGR
jgi:NADPH:quinone reductase-like Zn-dependent oxidoreductase